MVSLSRRSVGRQARSGAFTLLELLVSMAILAILLVFASRLITMMTKTYQHAGGKLEVFESARLAMETMERAVRQAVLNPYIGYDSPSLPTKYERESDMHFISGSARDLGLTGGTAGYTPHGIFFQAPLGLSDLADLQSVNGMLCATGFFLAYADDPNKLGLPSADKLAARYRYRLMQFLAPTESLDLYKFTIQDTTADGKTFPIGNTAWKATDWFSVPIASKLYCHVLAENVVAFAVLPSVGGKAAQSYLYNSRDSAESATLNQLPQSLKIVMAVIDSVSAGRLDNQATPTPLLTGNLFSDPASFDSDMASLETQLSQHKPPLNYRIFVSDIPIQAAQWSL
ncbi:hypothetical protein BH09VER1_BH09VER1_51780 [soil metagenome]